MKKSEKPVVVEQKLNASKEKVWKAITDLHLMKQWYFENIPAFKPEVGFETEFNVQSEERNFLHQWKITEVIPEQKITYSWEYNGHPGKAFVSFELLDEGDQTTLTLTNEVVEDFPDEIPEFKRESCLGGWEYFIQDRLKNYMENQS